MPDAHVSPTCGVQDDLTAHEIGCDVGVGGSGGAPPNVVPTTCDEAHGAVGCCSGDLRTAYYVNADSGVIGAEACGPDEGCGWDADDALYACVDSLHFGQADPTGVYPLGCGSPAPAGACDAPGDDDDGDDAPPDGGAGGSAGGSGG